MRATFLAMALAAASVPALADAPAAPLVVATDIAPVHSLVARVMQGVATPALVLPPGASPHDYAMRPSDAAALADAGLVVWIGPRLTPWLAGAIDALAGDARSLPLLDVAGTTLLDYREGPVFAPDAAAGPGEDAGDAPDRREATREGEAADRGDRRARIDPHAWLDPRNARAWLGAIAAALAAADPANAAAYRANAAAAKAEIGALAAGLAAELAPLGAKPFVVYHDAYRYFGHRFGVEAAGAIAPADDAPPGPARLAAIRDLIARTGAACVFAEPRAPADLVATVTEGTGARIATLDPLGVALEPGPGLYPQMLRDLAAGLAACLDPSG